MKKRMRLLLFLVLAVSPIVANLNDWHWQEVEYHYDASAPNDQLTVLKNYWMGETVDYFGETYSTLYSKVVYQDSTLLHPTGIYQSDFFVTPRLRCLLREDAYDRIYISDSNSEWLLFDFSDWSVGDTLYLVYPHYNSNGLYTLISEDNLDSILLLNGSYAQTVSYGSNKLIKGIGFLNGFLFNPHDVLRSLTGVKIVNFYKGDQLIWNNPDFVGLKRTKLSSMVKVYSSERCMMLEVPVESRRVEIRSLSGALVQSFSVNDMRVVASKALSPGVYLYAVFGENGMVIAENKAIIP